ncbi:MAG: hypothetical protein COV76_03775 [Candidatus Omnitrophica bacterium CG11_big_fil_rev_8_21_14_0_20_64_10]|nr:MAG: hypothetical protein COV76_03775 [Candidatus Omnitrophica bacterium CG11_big_fil_rev_8_21_14_0_20_64_10]
MGNPERPITLSECARITLAPDELITLTTPAGAEVDITRKAWGFYGTPSLNDRLPRFGLRAALVRDDGQKYFIHLVERAMQADFETYLKQQGYRVVLWLDDTEALKKLAG